MLFFKNLFPNLYGMANCWGGVGLGREGLHERRTHAHHTSRTHRPGAGVRGQGEESSVASLPAGTCTPSCGESGGQDLGAAPPRPAPPDCAPVSAGAQRYPVAGQGVFVLSAQAGRWAGRGLRAPLESSSEKGQKKTLSPPEADEASKHTVQNANPQATHPLIHPYTYTQFYLPLVAKIKLPSDTRSALRVSVQFNDD